MWTPISKTLTYIVFSDPISHLWPSLEVFTLSLLKLWVHQQNPQSSIPLVNFPYVFVLTENWLSSDGTVFPVALSSSTFFPYISCVPGPGSGMFSLFFIASSIPFFSRNEFSLWICHQITLFTTAFCYHLPFHRLLEEWTFILISSNAPSCLLCVMSAQLCPFLFVSVCLLSLFIFVLSSFLCSDDLGMSKQVFISIIKANLCFYLKAFRSIYSWI